jgi:hypothetical protein
MYINKVCVLKVHYPNDDALWLNLVAKINTRENIGLLVALYSFIL